MLVCLRKKHAALKLKVDLRLNQIQSTETEWRSDEIQWGEVNVNGFIVDKSLVVNFLFA